MAAAQYSTTTLTFTHGGGRFANQLMVFGHLIALAAEHPEIRIENISFWRFANLCHGTEDNPLCIYPKPPVHLAKEIIPSTLLGASRFVPSQVNRGVRVFGPPLLHKVMPWRSMPLPNADEWKLGSEDFLRRVRGKKRVLLSGWRLRDWDLFARHQDAIREFLKPATRFYKVAEPFVANLRSKHKTLIGVLIRQTDYRKWEQGKFFLSTEQYRSCLEKIAARFGDDSALVIASDERQPADAFDGLRYYWCTGQAVGAGHYLESFAELSLCDYIVSVPSTFSAWAAFFGRKPLLPILSADDDVARTPPLVENLLDAHKHPAFKSAVN